jgi:hypothetical protein
MFGNVLVRMGLDLINAFGVLEKVLQLPIIAKAPIQSTTHNRDEMKLSWLVDNMVPDEVSDPVTLVFGDCELSDPEDGFAIVLKCQHSCDPVIIL